MSLKEIRFDAKAKPKPVEEADDEDVVEIPINGTTYYARRPSSNSIALLYASMGTRQLAKQLAEIQQFLESCLEAEALRVLMEAVRKDALSYEELLELSHGIIAEFAANPTGSSEDSSKSSAPTGRASTERLRPTASTRASSRSRASSTRSTGS